jgi:hypothetical protein
MNPVLQKHGFGKSPPSFKGLISRGGLGAASNRIWFMGPWIGLGGGLGSHRHGQGHNAARCCLGFPVYDRLVDAGW